MCNFKIGDRVLVDQRLGIVDEYDGNNYIEINFDDGESKAVNISHCVKVEKEIKQYIIGEIVKKNKDVDDELVIYSPNRNLVFFNTEKEYEEYSTLHYGSPNIGEWSNIWEDKREELCVLKFKNDEFKIYDGRGQGSVVVVTEKQTFQSKNAVYTSEFIVLGPYFGEEIAYIPYVRV